MIYYKTFLNKYFKKSNIINVLFISILLLFLLSCSKNRENNQKNSIKTKIIDTDIYVRAVAIEKYEIYIYGIYTDEKTLGLKRFEINKDLETNLSISFVDKVGNELKTTGSSDKYIYKIDNGSESILYKDQKTDTKRILKYITKNIDEKTWTIYPQNISPKEYATFVYNDKIYVVYYEDTFYMGIIENNNIKKTNFNLIKNSKELHSLKITKFNDTIKIYFINENNELLENSYKITDKNNVEFLLQKTNLIDGDIKTYDVKIDGEGKSLILYYKEKDNSLNFYREGNLNKEVAKDIVGYFNDIYAIHLINLNEKFIFCISTLSITDQGKKIDYNKKTEERFSYPFILIYPKNKSKKTVKWYEEELFLSEIPILSINSTIDEESLYILTGNNNLTLIKIDKSKFDL